jgi:hypothetical protein
MSQDIIVAIIVSSATVVTATIRYVVSLRNSRDNLLKDLKIHDALPSSSSSKASLLKDIDTRIEKRIKDEKELTRDIFGSILAVAFLATGVYLVLFHGAFDDITSWSSLASALLILFGIVGFSESFRKDRRNAKGSRIKG